MAAWIALGCVLSINGAVRVLGGGQPALLSMGYLGEKVGALVSLVRHGAAHLVDEPHPDPRSALATASRRHRLPPSLALAVARAESDLDPHAISATGAMGLMQLMPETAQQCGVRDPFDTRQSADGGARYLAELWRHYGGARARVVAAYNAGPGRVPRRGQVRSLPGETRAYVERVLGPPGARWLASQ